jgi:hypothetical protein
MCEFLDQREIKRRDFLQLMLMASAAAIATRGGVAFAESVGIASHAALSPLAPGAVRVGGWLELYLRKQADELGSKLPQVSWPFTAAYWSGEEEAPKMWWPWEQKAYWVDGATRLALVLDDKELLGQTQAIIEYTLSHANADGYLGPQKLKALGDGYGRWPHEVFFRGVSAYADGKGDPEIAAALKKHYLADTVKYGAAPRNVTNVESILWSYERTGDPRLLALAERAWADYAKDAAGASHGDLSPDKVYFDTAINAHGVLSGRRSRSFSRPTIHFRKRFISQSGQRSQLRFRSRYAFRDGAMRRVSRSMARSSRSRFRRGLRSFSGRSMMATGSR